MVKVIQRSRSIPSLLLKEVFLIIVVMFACQQDRAANQITGTIFGENGPLEGAVVRIKTTTNQTITDSEGHFTLTNLGSLGPFSITSWKTGYYISGLEGITAGAKKHELHLKKHPESDNPAYDWLPSLYHPGADENQGCAACHSSTGTDIPFSLPVDEWLADSHSQSAANQRFLSMYNGTDLAGNQSPPTRYEFSLDYGTFPLLPDPQQPYFGPGYKLDFPESNGNCASCHTPAASVNHPYTVDPSSVTGVAKEGIPCDFCHKVWDVKLNVSGMPAENMPGVLSYEFRRPGAGHQLFLGPLDDVAPGEDSYSALQKQSQFCAPCHFSSFWGTVIYNSFGEWLESPYNDPVSGQQCQDCHMPPLGNSLFALPEAGGEQRDPNTIFSHQMPGAASETLLQNAVTMEVDAEQLEDQLLVTVSITNDRTGHHVPTDSPLRHLILLVDATDSNGNRLRQLSGPVTPDWVGVGEPAEGYYAGLPGKTYAKILTERWTQISPSGSYWNPTIITSDNRLAAFETDTSSYRFESCENKGASVNVTLLFRRAFLDLAEQKGWNIPDIVMEQESVILP